MHRSIGGLFGALMVLSGCSLINAADEVTSDDQDTEATEVAETEATTTTAAPTTTTEAEPEETTTTEDPGPVPVAYAGTGGTATAGPLTLTATQCTFADGDLVGADAPDHFAAVARADDALFLAGQDGEEETGLLKFLITNDGGCTLTPDAAFGNGGVLEFERAIQFTSGGGGRVIAAHRLFNSWVVNPAGNSLECGDGGIIDLSPDGSTAFGHFPGTGNLDRFDIGDGACTVTADAVTLSSQDNVTDGGWITNDLYVIGGFLPDGGAGVTAIDAAGNERWTVGGSPSDVGDIGYGTVSAVAPCGPYVCVIDSNFRELHILEPADGSQIGLADLQELTGLDILWFNGMTTDRSGALWIVGGLEQLDSDGEDTELIQGLVYRVTVG